MKSTEKDKIILSAKKWRLGKWKHVPKATHLVTSKVDNQTLAGGSSREMLEDVLPGIACSQTENSNRESRNLLDTTKQNVKLATYWGNYLWLIINQLCISYFELESFLTLIFISKYANWHFSNFGFFLKKINFTKEGHML